MKAETSEEMTIRKGADNRDKRTKERSGEGRKKRLLNEKRDSPFYEPRCSLISIGGGTNAGARGQRECSALFDEALYVEIGRTDRCTLGRNGLKSTRSAMDHAAVR